MSARPRDLLKTQNQRDGEVLYNLHLKSGQADSQSVISGNVLSPDGGDTTKLAISAGDVVLAQARLALTAAALQALSASANTAAGTFRKVLVERASDGSVSFVYGAAVTTVQADAVLPAGDPTKLSVGYIEVPASFTANTTALTSGMLKQVAYHA